MRQSAMKQVTAETQEDEYVENERRRKEDRGLTA